MTKKVLVVCEGHTDFVFIEGIFNHLGASIGKKFQLQMIAPQVDATTGAAEQHGWTGVKRWCELNAIKDPSSLGHLPEQIRRAVLCKNWEAIVVASNADLLLVQLDTDITKEIDKNFNPSIESRRDFCARQLNKWLGIVSDMPSCKYLLPTYAIENWLLATYDATNAPDVFCTTPNNYEIIFDVESRLLALGYPKKGGRLRKTVLKYKNDDRFLKRLINHLDVCINRCPELDSFVNMIRTI